MPVVYNVSQAAAVVGVSPSSLRNWCKQYAAYLSPGASPQPGAERVLSPADVATLQHIKAQRDQLKDYDTIIAELATMPVEALAAPYIDATATVEAPQAITAALQATDVLQALQTLADDRYSALQRRVEAVETRQGDNMAWFMFGVVAGVLLAAVAIGVVMAGAWWR